MPQTVCFTQSSLILEANVPAPQEAQLISEVGVAFTKVRELDPPTISFPHAEDETATQSCVFRAANVSPATHATPQTVS
jgi:hypothetical protein